MKDRNNNLFVYKNREDWFAASASVALRSVESFLSFLRFRAGGATRLAFVVSELKHFIRIGRVSESSPCF